MVKILCYIKSNGNYSQKNFSKKFSSTMKGFIYHKLEGTKFSLNRDNSNYRGFTFSNIFPIKNAQIKENEIYKLYISGIPELIMMLLTKINQGEMINLGEGSFELVDLKLIEDKIEDNCIIQTPTFICVRTNRGNGKKEFVDYEKEPTLYLKTLNNNLIKKYNFYNNCNIELDTNIFDNIKVEKINVNKKYNNSFVCLQVEDFDKQRKGKSIYFYGNKLRFKCFNLSELQKKILQIGVDCGFGSLNSYGCGYVNIKKGE